MINAISVDLEDWFCVSNLTDTIRREQWEGIQSRIEKNTQILLELFDKHNVKATFFVLGWVAEHFPRLIRTIDMEGHEIACHGYSHRMLTHMTPEEFSEDIKKSIRITGSLTSQRIIGYRAPSFTMGAKTLWALDTLKENGILYDSSVFPIGFHPDYGLPEAPLEIFRHENGLLEFPLSCVEVLGRRIPCSGGGYFRLFPYALTRSLLRRCNREGRPSVFYLHPWEIDPDQPRVKLPPLKRFRHYLNLGRTLSRLERLIQDFQFAPLAKVLGL
jgi:polysaccharide deacetylase family protein (PEP-CTERM system associated)